MIYIYRYRKGGYQPTANVCYITNAYGRFVKRPYIVRYKSTAIVMCLVDKCFYGIISPWEVTPDERL